MRHNINKLLDLGMDGKFFFDPCWKRRLTSIILTQTLYHQHIFELWKAHHCLSWWIVSCQHYPLCSYCQQEIEWGTHTKPLVLVSTNIEPFKSDRHGWNGVHPQTPWVAQQTLPLARSHWGRHKFKRATGANVSSNPFGAIWTCAHNIWIREA